MAPDGIGLAARLLRAAGGAERARRVLADLEEEWRDFHAPRGRLPAAVWFWGQVLRAIPPLARRRREDGDGPIAGALQDLGMAARHLARAPLFTATCVATLALGIGANTALFSVLRGVVLAPLPYASPDRIHRAWTHNEAGDIRDFSFRTAEYRALVGRTRAFTAVGVEFATTVTVQTPDGEPVQVDRRMISAGYFDVFGAGPALGRAFTDAEVEGGEALLAVVSHPFWRTRLGGDPDVVGATLDLDGARYEIVGVLPASWRHPTDPGVAVYTPYTLGTEAWIGRWLELYGRLAPNVGADAARVELDAVLRAVAEEGDRRSAGWTTTVEALPETVLGDVGRLVWLLFASVLVLLTIASVNVANLSLVRAVGRMRELRLRAALGASRGRLARHLLAENLLLAAAGGAAGFALGSWGLGLLLALAPPDIPRLDEVRLDPWVMAFTAAVALGTGIAFGTVPALRASASGVDGSPAGGRAGDDTHRTRPVLGGLVVVQTTLALTLLVGAALLVRSVGNLQDRDAGFDARDGLVFRMAVPSARYPGAAEVTAFVEGYLDALEGLPGVRRAGAGADLPLSGTGAVATLRPEAWIRSGRDDGMAVLQRRATPGLFDALGIAVLEGRAFDGTEEADGPGVLVLSRSAADALFPDGDAVGGRVTFRRAPTDQDWQTVVGVVADVQYVSADAPMEPQLYESHRQSPVRDLAVVVRTEGAAADGVDAVRARARELLREMDRTVPVYGGSTLEGLLDRSLARRTFAMTLFGLFAGVATLLTAAGIHGTVAFGVSRRTREIGVRMALGAEAGTVVRGVVGEGTLLVLKAIPWALGGAWLMQRALRGLLFGVDGLPAGLVLAAVAGTTLVAVGASWWPARRAAAVDPLEALRGD